MDTPPREGRERFRHTMKKTHLRLLLVEDERDDAQPILDHLQVPGAFAFEVDWVQTLDDAIAALDSGRYDCVLTDLDLGATRGIETLLALRAHHPECPLIVLSGSDDAPTAILALKSGAQDFLVKERTDRERMTRAIAYARERHRIEAQLRRQTDELRAFTYAVTHDLRTPLISIDYLVEEAREHLIDDHKSKALEMLDQASDRIAGIEDLIQDIHALARADEGPEDEIVDLQHLVHEALDDNAGSIQARGIDVTLDLDRLPPVRGNRFQYRQLIGNLVGNAVKYTRDNGGVVRVTAHPLGPRGASGQRISVFDNGPGVPPDQRERIFGVFQRATDSLGREIPGTGVGLAIAAKVAHHIGSWIHVRDAPDGGAHFYFDLGPNRFIEGKGPRVHGAVDEHATHHSDAPSTSSEKA